MECGKMCRLIRKGNGQTQKFVAGKLGKTSAWLNNIEHGRRKLKIEDAVKLAEVLGVPLENIFLHCKNRRI